jgi:acyl-CoA dehydrogenase
MAIDYTLDPAVENYRMRIEAFVREELLPLESDPGSYDGHENIAPGLLETLRAKARAAGLWSLQMPMARGGQGLRTYP